jgi:DNA-binding NtrC family response regulator
MTTTTAERVLIVEDEPSTRLGLTELVRTWGFTTDAAADGEEALQRITAFRPSIIISDLVMPRLGGLDLLRALKDDGGEYTVVILTAQGTVETAVEAIKEGAYDYLTKPIEPQRLKILLDKIVERQDTLREVKVLRKQLREHGSFGRMIGSSASMRKVYQTIEQAAPTSASVLIWGESGTGKELVAQTIHQLSPRATFPFIAINCAAIPETLLESEIFGHEKGAFTGAADRRQGCFELADRGTLFLDEIGEMTPATQVKLLRVLQEREIEPVGSDKVAKVNVRVIAATNVDLRKRVNEGAFRADLYYRLNVLSIEMPPLRDCAGDLPSICARLLDEIVHSGDYLNARITPSGLAALARYDWPGNVRELRNILERALILSDSGRLTGDDFEHILPFGSDVRTAPLAKSADIVVPYAQAEAEFERQTLESALHAANGQISEAARMLHISRATFYKKLAKFGLAPSGPV